MSTKRFYRVAVNVVVVADNLAEAGEYGRCMIHHFTRRRADIDLDDSRRVQLEDAVDEMINQNEYNWSITPLE